MKRNKCVGVLIVLIVVLLGTVRTGYTQGNNSVSLGRSFTFAFDHGGVDTTGYRVSWDGTRIADIPVAQLVNGSVQGTVAATVVTTRGAHILSVTAYNADAESAPATLSVSVVTPAPAAPTNFRITLQIAFNKDGTVKFKWAPAGQ